VRVALVGCGNVADRYARSILESGRLELAGATDLVHERAEQLVDEHGGTAYPSLAALLADDAVDVVVNLTAARQHVDVTAAALEAGRHVHSEKPLALRHEDARALADLARRRGLRLSCAPATLLGEAQQTMWKLVRDGAIGTIRAVYAEANWGPIETWHPAPESLYEAGPVADVGVYPLTILTGMLGPVRRVGAYGTALQPRRVTLAGVPFELTTPDFVVAVLELASGIVVRLTATFWVPPSKQRGIELHGDTGSIYLPAWEADSRLERASFGGEYAPVALVREPHAGIDWGRPLVDLADAIAAGRPHRSSAEHAAHVVEVLDAIAVASKHGGTVDVASGFEAPEPMDWAR
jgi:predicted dehydrogenase